MAELLHPAHADRHRSERCRFRDWCTPTADLHAGARLRRQSRKYPKEVRQFYRPGRTRASERHLQLPQQRHLDRREISLPILAAPDGERQKSRSDELEVDQKPPDAPVPVLERMDRQELDMKARRPQERMQKAPLPAPPFKKARIRSGISRQGAGLGDATKGLTSRSLHRPQNGGGLPRTTCPWSFRMSASESSGRSSARSTAASNPLAQPSAAAMRRMLRPGTVRRSLTMKAVSRSVSVDPESALLSRLCRIPNSSRGGARRERPASASARLASMEKAAEDMVGSPEQNRKKRLEGTRDARRKYPGKRPAAHRPARKNLGVRPGFRGRSGARGANRRSRGRGGRTPRA